MVFNCPKGDRGPQLFPVASKFPVGSIIAVFVARTALAASGDPPRLNDLFTAITLQDQGAEIEPVPTSAGGFTPEPELDRLSNILRSFNEQFGNIDWKDADKIRQVIAEEIPAKVVVDKAYQNAMQHPDKQNARIEHDNALQRVLVELLSDHTELFKQFSDNASFRKWLADTIFQATYAPPAGS